MAKRRKTKPVRAVPVNEQGRSEEALLAVRNLVAEHFDHAVILVSKEAGGRTEFLNTCIGNQFAIKGMIQVFVNEYINDNLEDVNGEDDDDDDDDSESWKTA